MCRSRALRSATTVRRTAGFSRGLEHAMQYAAVIEVDNGAEDPDEGRRGLREELLPVLKTMPGFVSAALLTAYDQGRGTCSGVLRHGRRRRSSDVRGDAGARAPSGCEGSECSPVRGVRERI